MAFSVAQSLNAKFPKLQKLVGAPKVLDFHVYFWIFSRNPKKTHGHFLVFSRNPTKHMQIFGFSAEILKNTCKFWDFQQKSKLKLQTLRESRSCNFHANLSASFRRLNFNRGWDPRSKIQDCPEVCWQNLGSRLKPIEISIGTKIQDPRFPGKIPEQSWILDLGSEPRLKFQSVWILDLGPD